ncbi:hypothetical protein CIB84_011468 [Bambusicola thoracicus]|uniref:Uncharacterized protein n=1 Tax=Bambusicola thoracicus TaxID=9083 RepID=A0A2P4SKZ5_BAMTH|nr:hypothetical protein CIB84_011468 [Bambusicola thoracicus]
MIQGREECHIPKLITPVEKGRDLEARLIDSYIIQCQAEAQEGIPKYTCLLGWEECHIPKLITPVEKGRDLEARLIDSYIIQCQAEAQEVWDFFSVTIARAIELKHNPGLIAALAYETANFYQKAGKCLVLHTVTMDKLYWPVINVGKQLDLSKNQKNVSVTETGL